MKTRGIASWVYVNSVDEKFHEYKLTLTISKEEATRLKAVGLKPKKVVDDEDDSVSIQYTFKRNEINKKTKQPNPKPDCVDAALQPYGGAIGNGSEVIVKHRPFPWDNKFGKGISTDLQGVQIVNLVEFEGAGTLIEGDDEEGFEVIGDPLNGDSDNFEPITDNTPEDVDEDVEEDDEY